VAPLARRQRRGSCLGGPPAARRATPAQAPRINGAHTTCSTRSAWNRLPRPRARLAATTSSAALRAIVDAIGCAMRGNGLAPTTAITARPRTPRSRQTSVPSPLGLHIVSIRSPYGLHVVRTRSMCLTGIRLQGSRRLRERQQARIPRRILRASAFSHRWCSSRLPWADAVRVLVSERLPVRPERPLGRGKRSS